MSPQQIAANPLWVRLHICFLCFWVKSLTSTHDRYVLFHSFPRQMPTESKYTSLRLSLLYPDSWFLSYCSLLFLVLNTIKDCVIKLNNLLPLTLTRYGQTWTNLCLFYLFPMSSIVVQNNDGLICVCYISQNFDCFLYIDFCKFKFNVILKKLIITPNILNATISKFVVWIFVLSNQSACPYIVLQILTASPNKCMFTMFQKEIFGHAE